MPVSERFLLRGAWYALEQCGLLLQDSVAFYERRRHGTAVAIAMMAREELGRTRILIGLAAEVHDGRVLDLKELESAVHDHVVRQTAGQLSIGFSTWPGSGLSQLIDRAFTDTPTPDSQAAWKELQRMIDRLARQAPEQRHGARLRALYVDPNDSGTDWNRPASFPQDEALRLLLSTANDYSVFRGLLDTRDDYERARAEFEAWAERPELPPPTWPTQ
jgi:AbiV family abortive infection protein